MKNLILIGMPGSGKTTVGQLVANRLGRPFVDLDMPIAEAAGRPIPEIFSVEGEAGFRRRETEALAYFANQSGLVIATGGGIVTRPENEPLLRQNGTVIWLQRPLQDLPTDGRPLSQSGDLEAMYTIRRPLYEALADRTVENIGDPDTVATRVMEAYDEALSD